MQPRVLIVGAGFAGSVAARVLAERGMSVTVLDTRPHLGGNTYDPLDAHGVRIHQYGPHIFHTNSERVIAFLSRFTEWRPYEHRVLAKVGEQLLPIPINRTTINKLYGLSLTEEECAAYLERVREPRDSITTSEDNVLASVGRDLCDKFFSGYTLKQWGIPLGELSASVAARIPTRTNDDDRYFTDQFQVMPSPGYTELFQKLLDHPSIEVRLGCRYNRGDESGFDHLVYTGPIDQFFHKIHGALPYRSLRFEHEHLSQPDYQPVGTVNYPNDFEYTRITEFKKLTGQVCDGTSIVREYPTSGGDPYYPIPRPENQAHYEQYRQLADAEKQVTFLGRLAEYKYYNMDQVVARSLKVATELEVAIKTR